MNQMKKSVNKLGFFISFNELFVQLNKTLCSLVHFIGVRLHNSWIRFRLRSHVTGCGFTHSDWRLYTQNGFNFNFCLLL